MGFSIILYAGLTFSACMALHIVIWRRKTPWVSSLILLILFLLLPSVFFAGLALSAVLRHASSHEILELAEILLLHLSFSSAYIATYPAVRAVSPTLDILLMIASSRENRMTEEEMRKWYTDKRLVTSSVDDLKEYRLIAEREGCFELRPLAGFIIRVFIFYRRLLKLPIGAG